MSFSKKAKSLAVSNWFRAFFGLSVVSLVTVLARTHLTERKLPSCDRSLGTLQVLIGETSEDKKFSSYRVCLGDIDGKVSLTSEPSAKAGNVIVNSLIFGLKSVFDDSRVPYGGPITSTITCENRKYLKERTIVFGGKSTKLILAVANGRQIFGACAADQVKYVSAVWAGYDESNGRVITIELFKPIVHMGDIDDFQSAVFDVFEKAIEHVVKN